MTDRTIQIEDIVWRLAALASLAYQVRYVVNGAKNEYVVDHELLNDVGALKYRIDRPENRDVLNEDQLEAIRRLLSLIDKADPSLFQTNEQGGYPDIETDDRWNELRRCARDALLQFGLNANEMTTEEIQRLMA